MPGSIASVRARARLDACVRLTVVLAASLVLAPAARGQVDSTRPGVRVGLSYDPGTRPGVIVLPVRAPGGDSIRAILQRDLDYGDRTSGVTGGAADAPLLADGRVDYAVAQKLGAAAVVQATLTPTLSLHVAVHDVSRRDVLAVADFPLSGAPGSTAWRLAVHGASDEVERWITGVRGIAATRVLFVRDHRVWIVDADGEGAEPLTDRGGLSPQWLPGGEAIVYSTLSDRGEQQIVVRDLGGGVRVLASSPVTNLTPVVSPDGQSVAYAHGEESGVDLFIVPTTGGSPRRLTVGHGTLNVSPSFSPDGRRVVFTSSRSGHPEVYITDADGADVDLLTSYDFGDQNYRSNPDWSPDGRLVAFQSLVRGQFQVMAISLRDRSVKRLTTEGRNEDPSWAPDARHVVVTSTRTGSQQLFVVDVETGAHDSSRAAEARACRRGRPHSFARPDWVGRRRTIPAGPRAQLTRVLRGPASTTETPAMPSPFRLVPTVRTVLLVALSGASLAACHKKKPAPAPVPVPAATTTDDSAARERARADSIARARAREQSVRDSLANAAAMRDRLLNEARAGITAPVYFEYDAADIRDDARTLLEAKLRILTANPAVRLRVAGHTDSRGSDEYNLALGQRRASSVKAFLTERGIDASRIEIVSFGEERGLCTEEEESCWSRNRRAEFEVTAGGQSLALPGSR